MTTAPRGRALITGAGGQVGLELHGTRPDGWTVVACAASELDVTDPARVREVLERECPTVVIHAAAYTAVDAAESDAERAEMVNGLGTANVADAAVGIGARLIYLSTDFVFDGSSGHPYRPGDAPNPLSVYGRSKLEGERAALRMGDRAAILRTAWVYSRHGQNFVRTMLQLMAERDSVGVVTDQVGTPTWARSLADAVWATGRHPTLHGILHYTDAGVASWYDFAVAIQEEALGLGLLDHAAPIRPLASADYPTPARRPAYSVLAKEASWSALGLAPPHWRVNLRRMLEELARE